MKSVVINKILDASPQKVRITDHLPATSVHQSHPSVWRQLLDLIYGSLANANRIDWPFLAASTYTTFLLIPC